MQNFYMYGPSLVEFNLKNSDMRPHIIHCQFVGAAENKPVLNVKSECFGGTRQGVELKLLSKEELKSLKKFKELIPKEEALGKALSMLGDNWIQFLVDNEFVVDKNYLVNFIKQDAICELKALPLIRLDYSQKLLTDCEEKNVGNEEKIKPSFFTSIFWGPGA